MTTMINAIKNIFKTEPAVVLAVVGALVSLAVSFGLQLTVTQTTAALAFIQVLIGLVTRSQVTPAKAPAPPA